MNGKYKDKMQDDKAEIRECMQVQGATLTAAVLHTEKYTIKF